MVHINGGWVLILVFFNCEQFRVVSRRTVYWRIIHTKPSDDGVHRFAPVASWVVQYSEGDSPVPTSHVLVTIAVPQ